MLMKTHSLFYVLLVATFCLFTSCEREFPEEIDVQARFLASYLTDVYSVGDSVYFTKEDGQIEGFVVTKNEIEKKSKLFINPYGGSPIEDDDEMEEGNDSRIYVALLTTQFKSSQHTISVYLNYTQEATWGVRSGTVCYGKSSFNVWDNPWGGDPECGMLMTPENYIQLRGENNTICYLHPNIGVVSIATWYERNKGDVRQEWTLYKHVKQ